MNEEEKRLKKRDKWAWTLLAVFVGIALLLYLDFIGFVEFFWH